MKSLTPIKANAGMYMMTKLQIENFLPDSGITDDVSFVLKLWEEEAVLLLPSSCFAEKNFVRVVTCVSRKNADEFVQRLTRFIQKYT